MDRDRILDDFEHCCHGDCYVCGAGVECKYVDDTPEGGLALMPARLRLKVLALLKEQTPVKPVKSKLSWEHGYNWDIWDCGHCGSQLRSDANYCDRCGHKVNWDDVEENDA